MQHYQQPSAQQIQMVAQCYNSAPVQAGGPEEFGQPGMQVPYPITGLLMHSIATRNTPEASDGSFDAPQQDADVMSPNSRTNWADTCQREEAGLDGVRHHNRRTQGKHTSSHNSDLVEPWQDSTDVTHWPALAGQVQRSHHQQPAGSGCKRMSGSSKDSKESTTRSTEDDGAGSKSTSQKKREVDVMKVGPLWWKRRALAKKSAAAAKADAVGRPCDDAPKQFHKREKMSL